MNNPTLKNSLENLLSMAAGASFHVSALERLIAIASGAGEASPLTGAEISAVLEPLRADLDCFFEQALSVLEQACEARSDTSNPKPSAAQ